MDKALGAIGLCMPLQIVAVLTLAITGDLMAHLNASGTVGSHLKHCEFLTENQMCKSETFDSDISDLTGTMYPVHGCNQVATLLYCLRK